MRGVGGGWRRRAGGGGHTSALSICYSLVGYSQQRALQPNGSRSAKHYSLLPKTQLAKDPHELEAGRRGPPQLELVGRLTKLKARKATTLRSGAPGGKWRLCLCVKRERATSSTAASWALVLGQLHSSDGSTRMVLDTRPAEQIAADLLQLYDGRERPNVAPAKPKSVAGEEPEEPWCVAGASVTVNLTSATDPGRSGVVIEDPDSDDEVQLRFEDGGRTEYMPVSSLMEPEPREDEASEDASRSGTPLVRQLQTAPSVSESARSLLSQHDTDLVRSQTSPTLVA
jgi:hypothetical protein